MVECSMTPGFGRGFAADFLCTGFLTGAGFATGIGICIFEWSICCADT
jgi:hypothetical protein